MGGESVDKNEDAMASGGGEVNENPMPWLAEGDVDLGNGFVEEAPFFRYYYVTENGERYGVEDYGEDPSQSSGSPGSETVAQGLSSEND